jgi:hypothetical protein
LGAAVELEDATEPSTSNAANRTTPTVASLAATPTGHNTTPPRRERRPWRRRHPIQSDFGLSPGMGVGGEGMGPQWHLTSSWRPKGVAALWSKTKDFSRSQHTTPAPQPLDTGAKPTSKISGEGERGHRESEDLTFGLWREKMKPHTLGSHSSSPCRPHRPRRQSPASTNAIGRAVSIVSPAEAAASIQNPPSWKSPGRSPSPKAQPGVSHRRKWSPSSSRHGHGDPAWRSST